MDQYFEEGMAQLASKERGFYDCSCGWYGRELSYADEKGRSEINRHRPYKPGEGHCPQCGQPFAGCFKPAELSLKDDKSNLGR